MPWNYDPDALTAILEEAGYETIVEDGISAVKDAEEVNQQIYINTSGKMRYQYARLISHTSSNSSLNGKTISIDCENRRIVNILMDLSSVDELGGLLWQLPEIAGKE